MIKSPREWPFNWNHGLIALTQSEPAVPTLTAGHHRVIQPSRPKATFVKSELMYPPNKVEQVIKRRRLAGKQHVGPCLEDCQEVLNRISRMMPRVGKREITESDILQPIQQMFSDKVVVSVVACRGTDRTMGPPSNLHAHEAPFRKTLMILRPSSQVAHEVNWERWTQLSHRQLIRPAHPCRLNVTVFARDREATARAEQPADPPADAAGPMEGHDCSSSSHEIRSASLSQSPHHEINVDPMDAETRPNSTEVTPDISDESESTSESSQQPDQEPETISHDSSHASLENDNEVTEEIQQLLCCESADAFAECSEQGFAFRCEFDVPIPASHQESDLTNADPWIFLVSDLVQWKLKSKLWERPAGLERGDWHRPIQQPKLRKQQQRQWKILPKLQKLLRPQDLPPPLDTDPPEQSLVGRGTMESMEEKVLAEMADLRRFIGDHFEKQQALLMGLSGVKTPKQLWPFVAKGDVTSSPCDLSMDEIPIEVYNGIAPQPTKAALEVEEEGILFKSPEMEAALQLGSRNSVSSDPMTGSMNGELSESLRSSDTFVNYTLKNFEKKAQSAAELLKQKRRCSMVTQMDRDSSARSVAKLIVKSPFFAYAVTSIITFNLIILGIEVDVSTKLGQEDIPEWFGICNLIVVILFTLEMSISLFAQGCGVFFCGRERWWNLFDLLIIIVSVLETILDFWATSESSQHVSASQLRFVRTVRLARALRGIRVMRLLRYVSALRTLVLSIMSSMASLLWTLVLLMLLFYSFGVLFTQLVSDECRFQSIVNTQDHNAVPRCEDESSEYWSSINESMLTLFMSITGGVDWEIALKPLRRISILAVICLVLYITVTFFAIVNVITGVFVTTAMETTSADKDLVVMKQLQKRNTQVGISI
ncbi:unnamed protein product [Cladocopium goreaui]|uniref:Voltage-dependent L-type calcium channel subunit alpha-1C n=1 Tax=Cladocopium goreaui TaxID=2562237 RepID=A0A9P1BKW0_9DINO|nr:unnamed protein product [Cladocopium goreaui]